LRACRRNWKRSRFNIFDLQDCSEDEITRIASYLGISRGELHCIASYSPDRADLLRHRMAALDLDPSELALRDSATWHDVKRRCETCDSRGSCALDLASGSTDEGLVTWRDYCPNAKILGILMGTRGGTAQITSGSGQAPVSSGT